ncbi:MAG TPA: UDP-N-acetylmuramoyl-L-alanyl-D-glutamate--2,6-diaminopimelate ligase [Actinomycetota bacterium]|nr:UDP-N-acetylmuramoyl-L-alanyl-D-glutamate--2,6-diaminopimelate ligase [Actinomycetota bacterium]
MVRSFPPVPLTSVARAAGADVIGDASATSVVDVALDDREVTPGSLFCCVVGARVDGHDHAAAAVDRGAAALLAERPVAVAVPQLVVPSVRAAMGPAAAEVFGHPARSMTIVGVTGTNGKTTVTYLLDAIFRHAGHRSGVIGTTGARVDGDAVALAHTTPEAPDLHRLLARMRDAGVDAVAMEVSSHALAQHRVGGLVADVAVFTNLSQDHLDFHPTMDAYFDAKATLFTPDAARRGVVAVDAAWGRALAERAAIPGTTIGVDVDAEVRAHAVVADASGIAFRVEGVDVHAPLLGRFNVANALAAIVAARETGIEPTVAADALATVAGVPGRMEPVRAGQRFLVMVDYAHTPDSILGVLRAARPLTTGRVIIVFGCGGDRDRAKRPAMGRVATAHADLAVLTSDNPRSEDPLAILAAVEAGARAGGGRYVVEPDRRLAIRRALADADDDDVVVIAGKGHETHQEIDGTARPFDDRVVAREELLALGSGA